jgi:methyl-accepting chemotaxis protein
MLSSLLPVAICSVLIIIYAIVELVETRKANEKDPYARLNTSAEHAYLLGYLYTFSAITGLFLGQIGNSAIDITISVVVVKLITTVIGLLALLIMRGIAEKRKPEDTSHEDIELQERVKQATADTLNSLVELIVALETIENRISESLISKLDLVSKSMDDIAESVEKTRSFHASFEAASYSAGELDDKFKGLVSSVNDVSDSSTGLIDRLTESIQNTDEFLINLPDTLDSTLTDLPDKIERFRGEFDELYDSMEQFTERSTEISLHGKKLAHHLNSAKDSTSSLNNELARLNSTMAQVDRNNFTNSVNGLIEKVKGKYTGIKNKWSNQDKPKD